MASVSSSVHCSVQISGRVRAEWERSRKSGREGEEKEGRGFLPPPVRSKPITNSLVSPFLTNQSYSSRCLVKERPSTEETRAKSTPVFLCSVKAKPNNNRIPSTELIGHDLDQWEASKKLVENLGFDEETSEKLLAKSFGWIFRGYWEDKIVDVIPDPKQVENVISYLQGLGLAGGDMCNVVEEFPHVLACSVEERIKKNVEKLDRDWKIKGPGLVRAIVRQPLVLGYSVDCRGDCVADCDHCWARF